MNLHVREIQPEDFNRIITYLHSSSDNYLVQLGIEKSKLPSTEDWLRIFQKDYNRDYKNKEAYYIIWMLDNNPIGHSYINEIKYEDSAFMHLHLWNTDNRHAGLGVRFLTQTIPLYFKHFKLKKLICQPKADNIAPNKILPKLGFQLVGALTTIPGWLNFEQFVNRYELVSNI